MLQEVIIRDGRIRDKEQTLKIWKELMGYSMEISAYDFDMVKEAPGIWMKYFEKNVRSKNRKAFVAEQDGKIIGYGLGCIEKRPPIFKTTYQVYVTDFAVLSKNRNKGVGTKLIAAFSEWARERGIKYLTLNVVPENDYAIKFYKKNGFITVLLNQRKIVKED